MKFSFKHFLKGSLIGAALFSMFLVIKNVRYDVYAWHGQLNLETTCEGAGATLTPTPNTDVTQATINGLDTTYQFLQWGDQDSLTFNGHVAWATNEEWNGNETAHKPENCGNEPSETPTRTPSPTEEPQETPDDPEPSLTPSPTEEPQNDVPSVNPPSFNACVNQTPPGGYSHYDYGVHQIVGDGLQEGSDDVYSLSDGNYLQCFCSVEDSGVQTFWWQVDGMSQADLDHYTSSGWYLQNGVQWNLGDHTFLAKNIEYYCGQPSPTPTLTPTPTPTTTTTPTPTPGEEPESRCEGLSASPTDGVAPLTVRFTGSGYDEDGDIKLYKFNFGDNSDGQPQIWEQEDSTAYHRYEYEGTYYASLAVKDSRGNWRNGENDCKIEIDVTSQPQVLGTSTTTELPKTGTPATFALSIITLTSVGAYLRKKFIVA